MLRRHRSVGVESGKVCSAQYQHSHSSTSNLFLILRKEARPLGAGRLRGNALAQPDWAMRRDRNSRPFFEG
jgi:hypothetical protein